MSRRNYNPNTPKTVFQLWVKLVKDVLATTAVPLSTFALLTKINNKCIHELIHKPGSSSILSPPDLGALDWMAKKGIIQKYKFDNRHSDYWGRNILVSYKTIQDDPVTDQIEIPSYLQPSGGSKAYTGYRGNSGASTPAPVAKQKLLQQLIKDSEAYDSYRDTSIHPAAEAQLLRRVDSLETELLTLKELFLRQQKEIETFQHRLEQCEIKEGVDRSKPKSAPKTKVEQKSSITFGTHDIVFDKREPCKLSSIKAYRLRYKKETGKTIDLKSALQAANKFGESHNIKW